jgi:hypothetical protein
MADDAAPAVSQASGELRGEFRAVMAKSDATRAAPASTVDRPGFPHGLQEKCDKIGPSIFKGFLCA